ncbi:MAG: InlB B-repeat-containing protein, partial [Verrucomicrobiota bacterium]
NKGWDYPAASYVTVTAANIPGYAFQRWTDRRDKTAPPLSTTPTLLIRMTQNWQIDAEYLKL